MSETNKPRNHLIKDATSPHTFSYTQYGIQKSITVNQTPEEETWPGGALWDIGVLLARVLVMVNKPPPSSATQNKKEKYVSRLCSPGIWPKSWKDCKILELGCGVGLTGLVGAQLGAKVTILTDLAVVVEKVTEQNVELNKKTFGKNQHVHALPLCWGHANDEIVCRKVLDMHMGQSSQRGSKRKIKKKGKNRCAGNGDGIVQTSDPDIVLIGDVAYQHKPGAPSHFDILMSTLLKFATTRGTLVMFGTRMRMPASADLLDMFREHFDELVEPIQADEIDDRFGSSSLGKNSMITIHLFKRKTPVPPST